MKRFLSVFTLCLLLSAISCDQENDPAPTNKIVFELDVPAGYLSVDREYYIIASAPDGTFLGMQKLEDGQKLVIDTALEILPDLVNITQVTYAPPNLESPVDNYRFFTSMDVPTGSTWYYKNADGGFSSSGFASVNITNFPAGSTCSASSLDGHVDIPTTVNSQTANLSVGLGDNPSDIFISTVGTANDPRYFESGSVTSGTTLNLDYNTDFLPFDHVISRAADGFYWMAIVRAYNKPVTQITNKEKNAHEFGFYYGNNDAGLRMGVNDGYSSYWSFWYFQNEEQLMSYEKWGGAPVQSSFDDVAGDFNITDESFGSFAWSTTGTFHYLISEFDHITAARAVRWSVLRPVGTSHAIMNELPDQLIARFPMIAGIPEGLGYQRSTFYRTTTAKATDLYIESEQESVLPLEGETWSIMKH